MAFKIIGEGELASMNHNIVIMSEKVAHKKYQNTNQDYLHKL